MDPRFQGGYFIDVEAFHSAWLAARLDHLPRCQELLVRHPALVAKDPKEYAHRYFISHRWDDQGDPDPRRWQFDALFHLCSELIAKQRVPACFWYDHCSLPQHPRTAAEQAQFDEGLRSINALCRDLRVVPLITRHTPTGGDEADIKAMLKRGWILVELFIAEHHGRIDLALFEDTEHITYGKLHRVAWRSVVPALMDLLPFYDAPSIRRWFIANGVECTNGMDDYDLLSRILHTHIHDHVRTGPEGAPPELEVGRTYTMTASEVSPYKIGAHGLSALFPHRFFEWSHQGPDRYEVTPRERPALPSWDHPPVVSPAELAAFRIDQRTGTSPLFPGIRFDLRTTDGLTSLRPEVMRVVW